MNTNKKIRSMIALALIIFAASTTSCKKEENITPSNTPTTPTTPVTPPVVPVTPPVVVQPSVSMKPKNITTTENGVIIRKQSYQYEANGKLKRYISTENNLSDSVVISSDGTSVDFRMHTTSNVRNTLQLNADKTFKSLAFGSTQINFTNSQTKLSSMTQSRTNGSTFIAAQFQYTTNNLSVVGAEARFDFNYYDNLPYQKGINEMPILLKPIQFYKVMELENATTTILYNKLLRQAIIDFGNRKELHAYAYVMDTNNRVIQITDTVTNVTSTTSTQKVLVSTIAY